MGDLKTHRDHPASMEERIRNRLRPSNDTANAESVTTVGPFANADNNVNASLARAHTWRSKPR